MANIGLPKLNIVFKGLGVSAVQRGEKGVAVLIVKDNTDISPDFKTYRTLADMTETEIAKYTETNVQFIKDCLEGVPSRVIVVKMPTDGTLTEILPQVKAISPRNCWIGIASEATGDHSELATWVKSENVNNKKAYKTMVYKVTNPDCEAVVNLANEFIAFNDERSGQAGDKAIPYLLGFFAGLPLTMSGIGKPLSKFVSVIAPADIEGAINDGKLVLYSEDSKVKIARAVNSLVTTGQDVTDDMKFILIVEAMHLIYSDIYDTWNDNYKGRYKNFADNQLLLVGAINSYFEGLENDLILDPNFENKTSIDVEAQRRANVPKFGEEIVNAWDNKKAMTMTTGTNVFLKANLKILNAFEDLNFNICM